MLFSFGERSPTGGYAGGFTLQNYASILRSPDPFITSLMLAVLGTLLCLLVGLPLAYYIATRGGQPQGPVHHPARHPLLDELPDPHLRLDPDPRARTGSPGSSPTPPAIAHSGSWAPRPACCIGLVYGYLPLMVFPLYVTLERIDRTLVEASKDLGAGRLATFRQITLPIALPGLITGSILVFIPMMGEYVIPEILGLRPGLHHRQLPGAALLRRAQLARRLGPGRRPDPRDADQRHVLPVVHEPRPARP